MSMLAESFKSDILEIIEISKACPEPLQALCLEMLLGHYLHDGGRHRASGKPEDKTTIADPVEKSSEAKMESRSQDSPELSVTSGDILMADLHVKAKKFLEKHGRTLADLNELFYKDGSEFKPLYDDLKTTRTSESQIRIALLQALVRGMKDGEFEFDGERVREECQIRKAYDGTNFTTNFNNNAILFDGFDKYNKARPVTRLSEAGRKKLAELIPDMK